jgi:small-conductance mechanosensitive channel
VSADALSTGRPWEDKDMDDILQNWRSLIWFVGGLLIAVFIALAIHYVALVVLRRLAGRSQSKADDVLIRHLNRPARWTLVVIAAHIAIEPIAFPADTDAFISQIFGIVIIVVIAWLLIGLAYALSEIVLLRFDVGVPDNLRARMIYTQVNALRRIVIVTVLVISLAAILMTFPRIRQLGAAILASAGIAGIVVGFAAQKTLGNLVAGLQIAFTQPMRIDDVVIVEGEWGRIEEITLTYVVVRIWDLRRLIVPITYFIEKPFQNWTRTSADILGTVLLYVDYSVPIDAIRTELTRILDGSPSWDRKVNALQVTNTSERTIELRALVSAADAGAAWDLRCLVREKLVEFVRTNYPDALPKVRAEMEQAKDSPAGRARVSSKRAGTSSK